MEQLTLEKQDCPVASIKLMPFCRPAFAFLFTMRVWDDMIGPTVPLE